MFEKSSVCSRGEVQWKKRGEAPVLGEEVEVERLGLHITTLYILGRLMYLECD